MLDGQGLNYALKMDATGTRVIMLILAAPRPPDRADGGTSATPAGAADNRSTAAT